MINVEKSEKEISKEFYEIFHQTRLMLIRAFQEKKDVGEKEALYYAQRFMHRAIFLFFALDNRLINNQELFSDTIFERLKKQECTVESKDVWNDIKHLFKALDHGDPQLDIHGFGGDFFSPPIPEKIYFLDFQTKTFFANEIMISKISKEPKLDGKNLETWNKFGDSVSPIIKNLLIMDSYDFKSTLNVTILGHILEQSLDDLNEFQKTGEMKRKIDGVFYTPVTLTNYICRNTIIPYLSKNNANTVPELISEYQDDLEELEKKTSQVKIVDPACGSGAFLINAAQILIEISESIQMKKGKPQASSGTLDTWQKEIETSKIIQNNIFGVDINRDSVEITKLSLFLMMAKPGEKLTNLSQNILCRNSLVNDKDVDVSAMVWQKEFPEIMNSDGFDIVIGNPPWQILKSDIDEFFSPLKEMKLLLVTEFPKQQILFSKLKKPKKSSLVKKCLENEKINTAWQLYLKKYNDQMKYFLQDDNFEFQISQVNGKKSSGIDINLYKLFVEKSYQILKNDGISGLVLPSGIYSDLGTKSLRQLLFQKCRILELCGFINRKPIFDDVHRQFKFCTLLYKKTKSTKKFFSKFRVYDDLELINFSKNSFEYNLNLTLMSSPNSLSIIECKDDLDQQILQKLYKFPLLQSEKWNFKASREFHMTDDAKLFHTGNIGLPLFEGKMMNMFNDNFALPTYWIDEKEGTDELIRKEQNRIKKFTKLKNSKVSPRIDSKEYRLVWRALTNSTNERTLISTILPPDIFLGNSLNYLNPLIFNGIKYEHRISYKETVFLCGLFNSLIIDFILRHKVASNLNIFFIMELPIPKFEKSNLLHQKILKNSSMLICTTDNYGKLRDEVGIPEFITEPDKRLALEAQINAYVAKVYDLTRDEFEYVLELFPSIDQKLKDMAMREFLLL